MKKTEHLSYEEIKRLHSTKREDQEFLKNLILDKTESKIKDKFSDKELDFESEKNKLLSDIESLWKIKKVNNTLLKIPHTYEKIFTQDYYKEIYRLNGWKYQGVIAQKPWKVGRYTNEIIYYRFSSEILPILRLINPTIIPGIRKFKHHQYLTPGARIKLTGFINEAVDLMIECNNWDDFRIKYCTMYNVPYQLKLNLTDIL